MSKAVFKAKVKKAAANEALKFLNKTKSELNKVKCVQHNKLEMQKYLSAPLISTDQSKFLFHLRSRMLFLKSNFRHMHKEDICPLCPTIPGQEKSRDSQEHLLVCKILQ